MQSNSINKILVPIDGSKNSIRALEMAITISKNCKAKITGVYCMYTQSYSETRGVSSISNEMKKEARTVLDNAKKTCGKAGVSFTTKILQGNIGFNIVKTAHQKNNKFDLIVIGSRGRSSLKSMFLGSTSNFVIHESSIPVLIVK